MRRGGRGESMCRLHRHRASKLYTGLIPGVSLVDARPVSENDTWPRENDSKLELLAVLKMMMADRHPNVEKRGQHRQYVMIGRIQFVMLNRLTAMVAYLRPLFFRASCKLNEFSNFCPMSTFDS